MSIRGVVSTRAMAGVNGSSAIRAMFEKAKTLRAQIGPENVFDYSLGNPSIEPPPGFFSRMRALAHETTPGLHMYMNNAGLEDVRAKVAAYLNVEHQPPVPLTQQNVIMTPGAAYALNVVFRTILNPGDEVIVPKPYFAEYRFYIGNHDGKLVSVPTTADFQLDLQAIEAAFTDKTKAVLINSPNNPTGAIYSWEELEQLAELVARKEAEYGHDIIVVTDEPYAKLNFYEIIVPPTLQIFPHSILTTSHSKDLGLAGERIGYLAVSPRNSAPEELFDGLVLYTRVLGAVNAPAFMQRVVADLQGQVTGLEEYAARRQLLLDGLPPLGFTVNKPAGSFYMMLRSPVEDDVAFVNAAMAYGILIVPGRAFEAPGWARMSYSSITQPQIARSMDKFALLAKEYNLAA